ncbi:hypothetical protein F443_14814, partial [Phytophthora nicotianae P1569]
MKRKSADDIAEWSQRQCETKEQETGTTTAQEVDDFSQKKYPSARYVLLVRLVEGLGVRSSSGLCCCTCSTKSADLRVSVFSKLRPPLR